VRRLFEVNSEPHTGARPSVRLCVGLINQRFVVFMVLLVSDSEYST